VRNLCGRERLDIKNTEAKWVKSLSKSPKLGRSKRIVINVTWIIFEILKSFEEFLYFLKISNFI
jgi:hypothetical protein